MRIVALGLHITGTGFTRVFDTLFSRLGKRHDIHWIGIAYKGPVRECSGYRLYPNNLRGGDMFGATGTAQLASEIGADVVLLINDVWMLRNYIHTLPGNAWVNVAYVPLDGLITDSSTLRDLHWLDMLVSYHPVAAKQFAEGLAQVSATENLVKQPVIKSIYHGVDTSVFTQPESPENGKDKRAAAKDFCFPQTPDRTNAIFILNANRFNERKDLETTLAGFAGALPFFRRPVYLCLHVPTLTTMQQAMLESWIGKYDIQRNVIINPLNHVYVRDEDMRKLYQACEIGVNTSLGEGWGLISFEHAACGAAQVIPDQPGLREIWADAGLYVTASRELFLPTNPFEMSQSSAEDLTRILVDLCNEDELRERKSEEARSHAHSPQFNWDMIAQQWDDLLKAL